MKTIVVIEDSTEIRENVTEILELEGFEVFGASNGTSGLQLVFEKLPQLVLCDISMPEMDGYEVLRHVRNNGLAKHIPFIFLTAKAEKKDRLRGLELGSTGYINKPFETTELLCEIERCLQPDTNS